MLFLLCSARAEDIAEKAGFQTIADFAESEGFDAWDALRALLSGEIGSPQAFISKVLDAAWSELRSNFSETLFQLAAPVILCAGLHLLLSRSPAAMGMTNLFCVLCCALTLGTQALAARRTAAEFLTLLDRAAGVMTPVLVSVLTLTGATASASIMTPLAAECAAFIDHLLRKVGLGLCAAASVVAVTGGLSARYPLKRLFELLKSAVKWLLGLSMLAFGAMMSARGLLGAARDSAAIQTAKMALENLIPVVGGDLSGSAGSLATAAGVVCKAVGFTGTAFIAHLCFIPLLKLGAGMLSLRLIAAMLEPLAADAPAVNLIGQFGDILELELAVCACAAAVTALLAGGCAVFVGL